MKILYKEVVKRLLNVFRNKQQILTPLSFPERLINNFNTLSNIIYSTGARNLASSQGITLPPKARDDDLIEVNLNLTNWSEAIGYNGGTILYFLEDDSRVYSPPYLRYSNYSHTVDIYRIMQDIKDNFDIYENKRNTLLSFYYITFKISKKTL